MQWEVYYAQYFSPVGYLPVVEYRLWVVEVWVLDGCVGAKMRMRSSGVLTIGNGDDSQWNRWKWTNEVEYNTDEDN